MSIKITAKANLWDKTVTNSPAEGTTRLRFTAVADEDGRYKAWADATPSLSVDMSVKGEVAEHFEQGATYTLTFEQEGARG